MLRNIIKYILKYLKYDIARCRQTKVERPSFVVVSKVSNNNHASGKSKDSCTEKKTVNNLVSVVYWREHMLKISFYDNVYLKFIGQLRLHWFLLLLGCCCFSFIFNFQKAPSKLCQTVLWRSPSMAFVRIIPIHCLNSQCA